MLTFPLVLILIYFFLFVISQFVGGIRTRHRNYTVKAKFVFSGQVKCQLENATSVFVSISFNGKITGPEIIFIIFDSRCSDCNMTSCTERVCTNYNYTLFLFLLNKQYKVMLYF